ncbi:hypothetical protein TIFTF001_008748 [Ficus carica]|uniref:Lipid droplet-associated hydrolase n=1 Tax=Ficus carica TaxID=3494 RepID=A0AA88D0U4_FICCA|nr:hypothetical protein TIFTF001_008748 [Ficus carica]
MGEEFLQSRTKRHANFRLCNVTGFTTELLEICADEPAFHVLFIPGNPGVVTFYIDFVESLYELLGGHGSVTAVVGYISHTMQNWEQGMVFTLQEQIDHKVVFIEQELTNNKVPIILVGHSIGAYASIEILKRIPKKVFYCIGLYPFLAVNPESRDQFIIDKISRSSTISVALSALVGLSGLLPNSVKRFVVSKVIGKKYSNNAVETVCSHLAQLAETPDWAFMREKQDKIAFLFGEDDHWGPFQMCEEISRQVPGIVVSIEREGHGHCFCGSTDGSTWVARHVTALINKQLSRSSL